MSLCLRRSGAVTLSLYSTCCYLLISGVSRMHRALSCVLSPLPHALQDEESRNRRASETARARFLVLAYWCVARLDISRSFSLTDSQTSRIYGREYAVWAIGTVPHRCTAPHRTAPHCPHAFCLHPRLLDINYGTVRVYTLRVRLFATFDPPPSPTTFIPALSSRFR